MRNLALLLGALVLGAFLFQCSAAKQTASRSVSWDEPFSLAFEEAVSIPAQLGSLKFTKLVKDHRCPRDAQCITQGSATVRVTYIPPNGEKEVAELTLGDSPSLVHTFSKFVVTVQDLSPLPWSDKPVLAENYTVNLVISEL